MTARETERPRVIRAGEHPDEYYTEERCHILELANAPHDAAVSIARARVEPGETTVRHRVHGTVERYIVLAGEGLLHIADLPEQRVGPDDVVVIPAGVLQSISNVGDVDLVFLCVCTPRFEWRNYESVPIEE